MRLENNDDGGHATVAVIGAGPIGLAAAANLVECAVTPIVLEQGSDVASHVQQWRHVRMFSTWGTLIDPAARELLREIRWRSPPDDVLPTGRELIDSYLEPLARHPALAPHIRRNQRVVGVARRGADKTLSPQRSARPFTLAVRRSDGLVRIDADAVIDASGTWASHNPLGTDGMPACGEAELGSALRYGMPDVLGRDRDDYAGRSIAVIGSGYSAANTVFDLVTLRRNASETRVFWLIRRRDLQHLVKDEADDVPARLALGSKLTSYHAEGAFELWTSFRLSEVHQWEGKITLVGSGPDGRCELTGLDRVVCNTGQRPDLSLTRELRLSIDPAFECVASLAPLIDPNEHSCYSVPPHGWDELQHPMEPGFYVIGAKSYGRASTFLAVTGYHQVHAVVAAIAGRRPSKDAVGTARTAGAI